MDWRTLVPKRRPLGFIEPCLPTQVAKSPVDPQWVHEIKHDGYRLIVCRRADRTRLFTRRGYDWTDRYPLIRVAAESLPVDATIDGEAVICDGDGVANFERLHSRDHDRAAVLFAFDLLELGGVDLRPQPLDHRKDQLLKLLDGCAAGMLFNEHLEDDGVFAHACKLDCEGIVSKERGLISRAEARRGSRSRTRARPVSLASRTAMR